MAPKHDETNAVRLSARTTQTNYRKLIVVAKSKGWLNAQGAPNVSKVLNFILGEFDASRFNKKRRKEKKKDV